jgi:3-keto-disaccharide hydrolase
VVDEVGREPLGHGWVMAGPAPFHIDIVASLACHRESGVADGGAQTAAIGRPLRYNGKEFHFSTNPRPFMLRLATTVLVTATFFALLTGSPLVGADNEARSLFNGKNLDGWDTWLGRPNKEKDVVGLNKDPKMVYTVVEADGKPAIRISGEIFGAITTKDEFENYHLKLEFKWGEKKWPPRENAVRDSGLLYHCVGPHGAGGGFWMQSLECQIQEHDCGDFWSVANAIVDVEGEQKDGKGSVIFKKGGSKFTVPGKGTGARIVKSADYEHKTGEWNTIELYTVGQTSVHLVNGKPNMVLTNARRVVDGKEVPLTKGKIQLQSEGAEVFYRNVVVRPIKEIPAEYLK